MAAESISAAAWRSGDGTKGSKGCKAGRAGGMGKGSSRWMVEQTKRWLLLVTRVTGSAGFIACRNS